MGIPDTITGDLNAGEASALLPALNAVLGGDHEHGIAGLIQRFESAGLGQVIQSWIGNGPNHSIAPEYLHRAIGDEKLQQPSARTGLSVSQLLPILAEHLPTVIERLTPSGAAPEATQTASA